MKYLETFEERIEENFLTLTHHQPATSINPQVIFSELQYNISDMIDTPIDTQTMDILNKIKVCSEDIWEKFSESEDAGSIYQEVAKYFSKLAKRQ